MAIRKALLNGRTVYAEQGEELRGADLTCIHCGARLHLHRYPNGCSHYFATNPGYEHKSVCQMYSGKEDAPVLDAITPEELIAMLSTITKKKKNGNGKNGGNNGKQEDEEGDEEYSPDRMTGLLQFVKI